MFMQLMLAFLLSNIHAKDLVCRFLATEESYANPIYKRKLVELYETEYSRQTYVFGRGEEKMIRRFAGTVAKLISL
jgi:NAD(P)H-dependent flavin oxidoreductase YrpB (nitropropane dioxygenase family)